MAWKSTADILREARALIENEARWMKGDDARDAEGRSVSPEVNEAVCWCAGGAIIRVTPTLEHGRAKDALNAYADVAGVKYPFQFNDRDETTHADVLAMFDRAIALAEGKA